MKKLPLGHVLGYTALTVILTAGAAQSLAGSNIVFTDDIADANVTTKDIKDGNVTNYDLQDGSVVSSKIRDNTVTGADVNESTLWIVPNAAKVNGVQVSTFKGSMPEGGAAVVVFDEGGPKFSLNSCSSSGAVLKATGSTNWRMAYTFIYSGLVDQQVIGGGAISVSNSDDDRVDLHASASSTSGTLTTFDIRAFHSPNFVGSDDCYVDATITRFP